LEASGRTAGSGSPASASGEGDLPDPDLVEAQAALRRAEVRLEAAGVTAGAGS